jgi:hypothetical protein
VRSSLYRRGARFFTALTASLVTGVTGITSLSGAFASTATTPAKTTKSAASVRSITPVQEVDHLLFCNRPERLQSNGVYAEAKLTGGKTYRIFFHYRNDSRTTGPLVMAFHGSAGKPLRLEIRKGIAKPSNDPPMAGRQAMARYMKSPIQPLVGNGAAKFTLPLNHWEVASGIVTVKADQDTRFRIYFKDAKRTIPGAQIVPIKAPRREMTVTLRKDAPPLYFRIGVPEKDLKKQMDGTYGVVYAFKVLAPVGSRVRITFSPRGGQSGMVASIGNALFESNIVDASQLVVLAEATVGKNGLVVTTIPFGGVFYPVEVAFHLL